MYASYVLFHSRLTFASSFVKSPKKCSKKILLKLFNAKIEEEHFTLDHMMGFLVVVVIVVIVVVKI